MDNTTQLREAFNAHITSTIGWTEFAKRHTHVSGKEYESAFSAGYLAALARESSPALMPVAMIPVCGDPDCNSCDLIPLKSTGTLNLIEQENDIDAAGDILSLMRACQSQTPPAAQPITEVLKDALYVIEAWRRGCEASDYWREISDTSDALKALLSQSPALAGTKPELTTLPQSLIDTIGEYGMARTDGLNQLEIQHRWLSVIAGIKDYARSLLSQSPAPEAVRDAEAIKDMAHSLQEITHIMQAFFEGGYGKDGDRKKYHEINALAQVWLRHTKAIDAAIQAKEGTGT